MAWPLLRPSVQENFVKRKTWATNYIFVFIFFLSMAIIACGGSGSDEEADEPAAASGQEAAQGQSEASSSDEIQGAAEEQVSAQSSSDEEATETLTDDSQAETGVDAGAIASAPTQDIQAMKVIMVAENLDTGETMEASYSFVNPDRFLANIMGLETLVIGDTSYMRIPQGDWTEQTTLPAASTQNAVEEMTIGFLEQATIYELIDDPSNSGLTLSGEESLNGIQTLVYAYDGGISSPLAGLIHGEVKVWIGKDDGLVYRQEVVNSTDSGLGPRSRSIIELIYGDAVSIEDPS
jgi:hypothetical protein